MVFSSYAQAGKSVYALNLAISMKQETGKSVIVLDIAPKDKAHSLPRRLGAPKECPILDASLPLQEMIRTHAASASSAVSGCIVKNCGGIDLLCFHYDPHENSSLDKIIGVLTVLVNDYHYILLDLPSQLDEFVLGALNQSDCIHLLTSPLPADLTLTARLIARLRKDFDFQESKINVVINEYKFSKLEPVQQAQVLGHAIYATLPKIEFEVADALARDEPKSEYSLAIRRIARGLGESQVGLALGVGLGYGFCHIGVLKVIESENIPIDVISGASIGALISSLWVTGIHAQEILEIMSKEFKEQKFIWRLVDLTFPMFGFIRGNRIYQFLKRYLGSKTFRDVRLPLRIIASDVRRKEPRVFESGSLAEAVMASCSMPGVFHPFHLKQEMLLDGGIINPLPTETLFKMGLKKIIAVNVTPSREDLLRQYTQLRESLGSSEEERTQNELLTHESLNPRGAAKLWQALNVKKYLQKRIKNNIVDIIFSSIELMQSELVLQEALLADVTLHPDTQGLHWMELHKAEEFAKRGEAEARKHLDKIWQLVRE